MRLSGQFFPLCDIEFSMAHPVADGPFVGNCQRGDMIIGSCFNPSSAFADDDGDLSFVVESFVFRLTDQRLVVSGKASWEPYKKDIYFGAAL